MKKAGITSFGTYIPYFYIERSTIGNAWGTRASKGRRSLANSDEDSLTLGVEAARPCLNAVGRQGIDTLYFASTTAPYAEKSHAVTAATACDLGLGLTTADFASSTRAGTEALNAALNAVISGASRNALVTAADCRDAYPKSTQEQMFGDGAAAVTVGTENVVAELVERVSVANEIVDIWRGAEDKYVRQAESRFIKDEGYMAAMRAAVSEILKKSGLTPEDFAKVVFTTPSARDHLGLAKKTGFNAETQLQNTYMDEIGYTGAAQPLMLLAAAAADARPGDKILLAAYGNGADAFVFQITDEIEKARGQINFNAMLASRREFKDYGRFLSFREVVLAEPGAPFKIPPSTSRYWREQGTYLRLHGSRCKKCGASIFPVNRVCAECGSKDEYEIVPYSDQTVKVFAFSIDKLAGRSDDPVVGQIISEAEDGARIYLNMTDFDPDEVKIGMDVEFTFRKIHKLGDFVNYYWRVRPVRKNGGDN